MNGGYPSVPDRWSADDLAFQSAVAVGALDNLAMNIKNVDIHDLVNVMEAFQRLTESVSRMARST